MDCLAWGLLQALPLAATSKPSLKEGKINSLISRAKAVALDRFALWSWGSEWILQQLRGFQNEGPELPHLTLKLAVRWAGDWTRWAPLIPANLNSCSNKSWDYLQVFSIQSINTLSTNQADFFHKTHRNWIVLGPLALPSGLHKIGQQVQKLLEVKGSWADRQTLPSPHT